MAQIDRSTLLYIIVLFIFLSLPTKPQEPSTNREKEQLSDLRQELKYSNEVLANSSYSSGYGNLTGFKLSCSDSILDKNVTNWPFHDEWHEEETWSILPNKISDEVKGFWGRDAISVSKNKDNSAYMLNITGKVYSDFQTSDYQLHDLHMPLPKYLQSYHDDHLNDGEDGNNGGNDGDDFFNPPNENYIPNPDASAHGTDDSWRLTQDYRPGNVTDLNGYITFDIKNRNYMEDKNGSKKEQIDNAVFVTVGITVTDFEEIKKHEIITKGVYFQDSGALITTTRSGKFFGYHGLPHLTLSEGNFDIAKTIIMQQFNQTDINKDINIDYMNEMVTKADQCEFVSYMQFNKTALTKKELRDIDNELVSPLGRPIPQIPNLMIQQALLYSPDCGVVLKVNNAVGVREEVQYKKLKTVLIGMMSVLVLQLYLSIRQMNSTNTPSTLYKISFYTLALLNFTDGLLSMMFLLMSAIIGELYLILICCAFITFILASIFEMRYMIIVYQVQSNERGTTWWELLRGSTTVDRPSNDNPSEGENRNLLPVTERVPEPIIETEANISSAIYGRFFFLLITFSFLILNAFMWRFKYRRIFEFIGLFVVNSYWLPQFFRNTLRGSRRSFRWEFVLFTSVIRLLPIAYLCLFDNPLRHHYDPFLITVLAVWVSGQVFALYMQEILGARFWINEKWLPKSYDYYPVLSISDLENGFSGDVLQNIQEDNDTHELSCKTDCAICMNEVEVPVSKGPSKVMGLLERRDYMLTPCRHIFHSDCLEAWMRYKLQCPVCRNSLPPI